MTACLHLGRVAALLATCLALGAALDSARAAEPTDWQARVDAELDAQRFGNAVVLCELAAKDDALDLDLRAACGKAYLGLGDKLLAAGSPENARRRFDEAAAIDPRLMDDPEFVRRLTETTARPPATVPPSPATTPPPGEARPASPAEVRPRPLPRKPLPLPEERTGPPPDAGPRWDRDLGLGLSFGFDGLAAATLGWLTDETLLVEVSVGIVYPTADVRVRWLGLRNCVTPYLGLGLLVPFGEKDRMGIDLAGYHSLYELGEAFHVDLGLAYTPVHRLDLFAGVAFMTPLDQDHPDTVLFFPQFSAGAAWFF